MRLGGHIIQKYQTPEEWINALKSLGYRAAYCPVDSSQPEDVVLAYRRAAEKEDIVIAEVGAWSNPLSLDPAVRDKALKRCITQLRLGDVIGARCCVNIAGSRGEQWDGPHPDNFTQETFDMIVETIRTIIDAVKPQYTCYALEPMPWIFPDSPDDYLRLIRAIDRKMFAVHLDPVNVINSPRRFYENTAVLEEWFTKLGPYIISCHAKDISLSGKLTVHLDEAIPGLGQLDYRTYLRELNRLHPDIPLMLEHLSTEEDYKLGADYIRSIAKDINIQL